MEPTYMVAREILTRNGLCLGLKSAAQRWQETLYSRSEPVSSSMLLFTACHAFQNPHRMCRKLSGYVYHVVLGGCHVTAIPQTWYFSHRGGVPHLRVVVYALIAIAAAVVPLTILSAASAFRQSQCRECREIIFRRRCSR